MYRIFPSVLSADDLVKVRDFLQGVEFHDGSKSVRNWIGDKKHNSEADAKATAGLGDQVLKIMRRHPDFESWTVPVHASHPIFNRHANGDYYRRHEDSPVQGNLRTDLSYTIFLSPPDSYDGGELALRLPSQDLLVKEPAGTLVVYDSGIQHEVRTVTRGLRYAAVGWLQSGIPDSRQRELLYNFRRSLDRLWEREPGSQEFNDLTTIVATLTRWWYRPR